LSAPPNARRLSQAHSIEDLRDLARRALPKMVFDYVDGAAQSESTAQANRLGLDQVALLPAPLRDVSRRSTELTLFGKLWRLPVIIGPTGFNGGLWPLGDIELARAAAATGVPFVMSYGANVSMAELRSTSESRCWFQLYVPREPQRCVELVKSVAEAGF
jgi:(S)-mandelate dehydrogenase